MNALYGKLDGGLTGAIRLVTSRELTTMFDYFSSTAHLKPYIMPGVFSLADI